MDFINLFPLFFLVTANKNREFGDEPFNVTGYHRASSTTAAIPCDKEEPFCQKFELMFQQSSEKYNFKRNTFTAKNNQTIEADYPDYQTDFNCDENPICKKFQWMLMYQSFGRNHGIGSRAKGNVNSTALPPSNSGPGQANELCKFLCSLIDRPCYASTGRCGEYVNEEKKLFNNELDS